MWRCENQTLVRTSASFQFIYPIDIFQIIGKVLELIAINMNITPYEKGNIFNKDPLRPKKLLLHKSEINKLAGQLSTKGYTLVPLQVYLKYGKVKMQIGLAKGKKNYDKRDSIAKKDQQREAVSLLMVLTVQPSLVAALFLFPFVSTSFLIISYLFCSFILNSTFLIITSHGGYSLTRQVDNVPIGTLSTWIH